FICHLSLTIFETYAWIDSSMSRVFDSFKSLTMFVGIITGNPYEVITRALGSPRSLKACCIC
ncbi:MAG: hypothetical protein K6253_02735, partial [Candidatus Liberibacter asiaticus]|nr:hypothetical protein [Candidatus Liberibacter asiaticus]